MSLHYKEIGSGSPLIILHGIFGSLDNWMTIAKSLEKYCKVYLVDQRNHGRSFHHAEFNYQVLTEDLLDLIDSLGLSNPILLGHSMGGKVVMNFALTHSHRVRKLIVVDIAPRQYPVHHKNLLEGMQALNLQNIASRGEADHQLSAYIEDSGVRQFLLKNLARNEHNQFEWKLNLDSISKNLKSVGEPVTGGSFNKPALFIRGEKSDYIRDEDITLIKDLFNHAKIETIRGAGHWVHADKPADLLIQLFRFL